MKLPTDYRDLDWRNGEVRAVREEYIQRQNGLCMFCNSSLEQEPPEEVTNKQIDWRLFPDNFLEHPIHLQHCHTTHMTEAFDRCVKLILNSSRAMCNPYYTNPCSKTCEVCNMDKNLFDLCREHIRKTDPAT